MIAPKMIGYFLSTFSSLSRVVNCSSQENTRLSQNCRCSALQFFFGLPALPYCYSSTTVGGGTPPPPPQDLCNYKPNLHGVVKAALPFIEWEGQGLTLLIKL